MNHRDAGAFERTAPTHRDAVQPSQKTSPAPPSTGEIDSHEILVVVSKLKAYIREKAGMNTSDAVMDLLSDKIRMMADLAIENANFNNRKTVLDRDVPTLK
jgi:hypothetical protein